MLRRFLALSEVVLSGTDAKGTYQLKSNIDLTWIGTGDDVQAETVADESGDLSCIYARTILRTSVGLVN